MFNFHEAIFGFLLFEVQNILHYCLEMAIGIVRDKLV